MLGPIFPVPLQVGQTSDVEIFNSGRKRCRVICINPNLLIGSTECLALSVFIKSSIEISLPNLSTVLADAFSFWMNFDDVTAVGTDFSFLVPDTVFCFSSRDDYIFTRCSLIVAFYSSIIFLRAT